MKTRLSLKLMLPNAPAADDACYQRLCDLFAAKVGVESAHLVPEKSGELCVHFDPDVISVQYVRRFAAQAGAELESRYGHILFDTEPLPSRRARRFTGTLSASSGVPRVRFGSNSIGSWSKKPLSGNVLTLCSLAVPAQSNTWTPKMVTVTHMR